MGCDIHCHVEIKENGQWQYYNWRKECETGEDYDGYPKYDYDKMFDHPLYLGRNYNLFAILANVRNGRGFAGVPTGTGFKPIAMPRGLPEDVTEEVKKESDGWNGDGHSHSWLTLDELLEFDWDYQFTTQYGVISEKQYIEYKETGEIPDSYAGDVFGSSIVKLSHGDIDDIISGKSLRDPSKQYYTTIAWDSTYRNSVGDYVFRAFEYLQALNKPVRLVFWFDN